MLPEMSSSGSPPAELEVYPEEITVMGDIQFTCLDLKLSVLDFVCHRVPA
jgi:hypothetical protein